jgi:type IV pilus assembly protein PilV
MKKMNRQPDRFLPRPRRRDQQGMSLLEVLVAVLIMGIGLLGIAAMQATALRNSQSALERSQAVVQTYAILDAMRANRDGALAGAYNTGGFECTAPGGTTLAQADRAAWLGAMKQTMGQDDDVTTCGSINCNAGLCTVAVRWDDSRARGLEDEEDNPSERTVTTRVRL